MAATTRVLRVAEFNPKIRTYQFIMVAFLLTISFIGIPLLIFWFLGFGQYYSRRHYKGLMCQLTDRNLEFKKGVLFRVEKTIPLENIQDLTFIDNPILRWLDLRILKIETAGQSNPQGSDMKLVGIIDTNDFKEAVLEQREVIRAEKNYGHQPAQSDSNELMDVLKDIKGLLEEIKNK
ncbi:PH domain-containing protein [Cryomorphaceae bacterium 1068]|nr:PH domain-containing protein [Cryomorphaceae bacterium 1068]